MRLIAVLLSILLASPASAGQMSLLGAGKSVTSGCADSNVIAWKAAVVTAGGTVSGAQDTNVCALVNNLKGNGGPHSGTNLFTAYDRIWLLSSENLQQSTINLVNPANTLTNSGATFTFTSGNQGAAGNGTSTFVDTNFAPSNGVNYTLNSAGYSVYVRTNRTAAGPLVAVANFDGGLGVSSRFMPLGNSNTLITTVNDAGSFAQLGSQTNAQGFFTISRTSASTVNTYKNSSSTSVFADTTASASPLSGTSFYIDAENWTGGGGTRFYSDDQIGIVTFQGGQTNTNAAAAQTDFNCYMQGLPGNPAVYVSSC